MLRLTNISYEIPHKDHSDKILSSINLTVNNSEFVTILGKSGVGKTTLLKIASGILFPTQGQVSYRNSEIYKYHGTGNLAYVPQESTFFPHRTVYENVEFPLEVIKIRQKSSVSDCLQIVRMKSKEKLYVNQLSGGMKQRVALARALVTKPSLLFLDEPFSSLDEFTREMLDEELIRIKNKTHMAILFVTHNINEAVFLSDKIVLLSKGKIYDTVTINFPLPRIGKLRASEYYLHTVQKIREQVDELFV